MADTGKYLILKPGKSLLPVQVALVHPFPLVIFLSHRLKGARLFLLSPFRPGLVRLPFFTGV
ncbi:hypothetical protein [Mailhella massiliensis]|uniref:hypothetical protein n=1 Tax=Mailhella massiliensis TaxID=1903261 RepID=UPI001EF6A000|nr:hypothetical protein [Mailhella massiliensis]